jgi:phosphoribosylaminoimidazole-succinocarboxamide synthase
MPDRHPLNRRGPPPVFETRLSGLSLLHRGKVRDLYALDAERLLIVTTDRLSAFDVVLPDPIPDKGRVLTEISNFWFARTRPIVANHLTGIPVEEFVTDPADRLVLERRAVVVRRLRALPIEAVVRGYLIGSGWNDYQRSAAICDVALPPGLKLADRLPEPIFTPATKAAAGAHDQNVPFAAVTQAIGPALAEDVRRTALALYAFAADHALSRGIIIADTKFEFGVDASGRLVLIDELLTPDSSRFWPVASYQPGRSPPSFDKQYVRDYLESLSWDKRPPAPHLPAEVVRRTSEKYLEALALLTAD